MIERMAFVFFNSLFDADYAAIRQMLSDPEFALGLEGYPVRVITSRLLP